MVRASYLELYNEHIRDLISNASGKNLQLKETMEGGIYVRDLKQIVVNGASELKNLFEIGRQHRATHSTKMNQDSSRSHSIFTVIVECKDTKTDVSQKIRVGKLHLVDLAGSERQKKTDSTGDRLKEGIQINLSLTALGNVISSLVDKKTSHIPYRDSKLTRLLQVGGIGLEL